MTILNAVQKAKWWIIEIGTNQFGEIAELSNMVRPTAGIITNIGESHLEFLENTAGVAKEKSGLFAGMTPENKGWSQHYKNNSTLRKISGRKVQISPF